MSIIIIISENMITVYSENQIKLQQNFMGREIIFLALLVRQATIKFILPFKRKILHII